MNRLTLCLITDRKRLCAATAMPAGAWAPLLLSQISGAIAGGVDVVQIRERDLDARTLVAFVKDVITARGASPTHVIVNDRLDVGLAAGADGVHLREDSVDVAAARRIGHEKFLIGRSIHSAASAARARFADYLIAGSVFETASKAGQRASLGVEGLREVVRAAAECPVWAVGGLTAARARVLVESGAEGAAAIGAFLPSTATDVARDVQKLTKELRNCFDSAVELS